MSHIPEPSYDYDVDELVVSKDKKSSAQKVRNELNGMELVGMRRLSYSRRYEKLSVF
ncbi:hypothetical protein P7H17_16710 [Paenibacillus larvae]|nr:hypothetical protein [Paenibacillus larvae]MDT2287349.1 hypothetical protein [Paenibacillus larvae]